jgi:hypothetical protein
MRITSYLENIETIPPFKNAMRVHASLLLVCAIIAFASVLMEQDTSFSMYMVMAAVVTLCMWLMSVGGIAHACIWLSDVRTRLKVIDTMLLWSIAALCFNGLIFVGVLLLVMMFDVDVLAARDVLDDVLGLAYIGLMLGWGMVAVSMVLAGRSKVKQ